MGFTFFLVGVMAQEIAHLDISLECIVHCGKEVYSLLPFADGVVSCHKGLCTLIYQEFVQLTITYDWVVS